MGILLLALASLVLLGGVLVIRTRRWFLKTVGKPCSFRPLADTYLELRGMAHRKMHHLPTLTSSGNLTQALNLTSEPSAKELGDAVSELMARHPEAYPLSQRLVVIQRLVYLRRKQQREKKQMAIR